MQIEINKQGTERYIKLMRAHEQKLKEIKWAEKQLEMIQDEMQGLFPIDTEYVARLATLGLI